MTKIIVFIKQHPVGSYCLLTLAWSFTWWALILTVVPIGALMQPPLHPLALLYMLLGGISPSIVGLGLTRVVEGKGAARALLARLGQWRNGGLWLALLIPWTLTIAPVILYAQAGGTVAWSGMGTLLPVALGLGVYAGLFEEFGWRGFLLPQLQRRYSPFVAALLVGLVWGGLWHFYGDWVAIGDQGGRSLLLVILQAPLLLTADSVLLTWVYNRSQGSMLLCMLFHGSISASALLFGVTYPTYETQLLWTALSVALWCVAAGAVVLLERRHMLVAAPPTPARPRHTPRLVRPAPGKI